MTNGMTITKKEKEVFALLDAPDERAWKAVREVRRYLDTDDKLHRKNLLLLFDTIYIRRSKYTKWRIANDCNISHRTLFRYRHAFIELFYSFFDDDRFASSAPTTDE